MSEADSPSAIKLDPDLESALLLKAELQHRSVSDIVNEAVRLALEEDESDLATFDERALEPTISLDELLEDLKGHGRG
jgi:predicted transcriptional regulator